MLEKNKLKKHLELRPSTLEERKEFYQKEFSIKKIKKWFKENHRQIPQLCAIDAGSETGIIINKKLTGKMLFFPFAELKQKIRKYIPEDVYYDRNTYKNYNSALKSLNFNNFISQELVFDIDSDNIKCDCKQKRNKNPAKKRINDKKTFDVETCDKCIKKAYKFALKMKKELSKDFSKIKIIYSGRGFHLHVLDRKAYFLTKKQRAILVKKFSKYPIDEWVTKGFIHLIRMPFSLNSLVSRKVIPINKNNFNKKFSYPKFLATKI